MISRQLLGSYALVVTMAATACGGSQASVNHVSAEKESRGASPSEGLDPSSAASTKASDEGLNASTAKEAAIATDQPKAASARGTPSMDSVDEAFPSGLVIDQRFVGGPAPGPELPKGTKVLHIGDSFGGALGLELNKVFYAAGLKGRLEFETATYIPTWAHHKKLPGILQTYDPDLILISLGANELENPEPEKRGPTIKRLVSSLGGRACVWVAPVLWEGAKSRLLDVIRENSDPCVYLDSNRLVKKMPRALDRIHPSMAARPDWALATARWLAYHRKPAADRPWFLAANP